MNGTNTNQRTDGQLNDYAMNEEFAKIDLNNRSNVGFLYKNGNNLDQVESIDIRSHLDYNTDYNSISSTIRKNSKVLFSKEEPSEDECSPTPKLPTNYSVATMLEQNDFAVSDIYQMARELKRTYLFKVLIMGDANTGRSRA